MHKVTVAGGIEIDCCDAHGVWLDVGEMAALLNQQAATQVAPAPAVQKKEKGMLDGVGKRLISGAAHGAGWGAGSTLASTLIRKLFG
jgi:hypothetical protein